MPFYAVANLPLSRQLKRPASEGPQAWYANDSAKGGNFRPVRE